MGKSDFEFKGGMPSEGVLGILKDLVKGLEAGSIYIRQGDEYVSLTPADTIAVSLKAGQKKDKERIELSLSWRKELVATGENAVFSISAEEPVIEAPVPAEGDTGEKAEETAAV